ncbi:MAG: sigma-70 family RNA polymerase sigma factor [Cyanobacteria bacterium]|jgi:RNA polymerase sigma factor (sigma-70 family)|nr:sigma-70 family RNA polymerase sigma factor [Cyanobacteria bacterium GSL.Bin1]
MLPRQDIIEKFSTFIQFDLDRFSGWVTDSRLRQSMRCCLSQSSMGNSANSDHFWALYWYKFWQRDRASLARGHLSAYLQEVCYWAAHRTVTDFSSTQYSLSDRFQAAIASMDKILKGFDPNQGFKLKSYASSAFHNQIRVFLRQRQEIDICSDWGLLRKISQKRLTEALQNAGLTFEMHRYLLAWNCFKTVYVPTQASSTRKLAKPTPETWETIAELYNSQRYQSLPSPGADASSEQMEQWLLACAKAARAYFYPTVTSINTPKPGQERELVDTLAGEGEDSLLTELIVEEETEKRISQQTQVQQVLTAAITELTSESQQLLVLYYAEQLSQKNIAQQLGIKQYTVSRRLTKVREFLLQTLAQWSQETLHISLTSDVLKSTSALLEEWLVSYYREPLTETSES